MSIPKAGINRVARRVRWHFAPLMLFVCVHSTAFSQDEEDRPLPRVQRKQSSVDYGALVASLENRNPEPRIVGKGPSQRPLFAAEYDWKEQERVLDLIQYLVEHPDEAWLALIEHLDDKHYCITFGRSQSVGRYTVGSICSGVMKETLTAGYLRYIPLPAERRAYVNRLKSPKIIPRSGFREWCVEQRDKGKQVYELQVEMCEWAISEIRDLSEVPQKTRDLSIAKIEKQIEILRSTKKPVLIKDFTDPEFRWAYSKKDADAIREEVEGKKAR